MRAIDLVSVSLVLMMLLVTDANAAAMPSGGAFNLSFTARSGTTRANRSHNGIIIPGLASGNDVPFGRWTAGTEPPL